MNSLDWNTTDAGSGFCGFVTEFDIPKSYLQKFEVQNVGGHSHNELWIPAEKLAEFNQQIIGNIEVSAAFYGKDYVGNIESSELFKHLNVKEQYTYFLQAMEKGNLQKLVLQEKIAVQANSAFWRGMEEVNKTLLEEIQQRQS